MKLAWLDINASYSHSSLALAALEAQLDDKLRSKCEWHIVEGTIKSDPDRLIARILEISPDFIFATCWLFNHEYLMSILSKAKALNPNISIILGGPEFLGNNRTFLQKNSYVTAVFKGEGEEIFPQFIRIITGDENRESWRELPGFEYKENQTGTYIGKNEVKVEDFAGLKSPEESGFFRWDKAFIQIETSRNCFNSCRFCVSGIGSAPIMNIPLEELELRLQRVVDKGIREIRILDRTFNGNPKRAVELLEIFNKFNGKLKFHLEIHPALLNLKIREKLQELPEGLLHIEAGIQSLNGEVLELSSRKGDAADAIEGLRFLLSLKKFEIHTDFIAGLPGYSYTNLMDDIRRMVCIAPDEIQLELLKLLPGTHFRENAFKYGIKYSPLPPYEVLQTEEITFEELKKSMILSKMIEFWYNDSSWREYFSTIVREEPDFLANYTEELYLSDFAGTLYSYESKAMMLYNYCRRYYPKHLQMLSLGWICNGLSIKKEPAQNLKSWKITEEKIKNPLFEPENYQNSYWWMDIGEERYWFVYNKSIDRNRPVKVLKERRKEL